MLKSIYIEKLFGLYTYTLDIMSEKDCTIRFITGPNGYGKTTILNILECLYKENIEGLSKIPFDVMLLSFDDGYNVNVNQTRDFETQTDEADSDEPALSNVKLEISFYAEGKENDNASIVWESNNKENEIGANPSFLYLKSHPVYFIKDSRLWKKENVLAVNHNVGNMKRLLEECAARINVSLQVDSYSKEERISEKDYNNKKDNMKKDLDFIMSCGLLKTNPLPPYNIENAGYLMVLLEKVSSCLESEQNFLERLKCFCSIIEKNEFVDKQLQINPLYGYRFIADNKDKTILLPDRLSSGEQHILIMTYDLLFNADDASLVLIDEPEISFHIMWQLNFHHNLRKIISLRKLQCIVCTHSPQVFENEFDLTLDLYEQTQKRM